jgi:hypothetical protein
MYKSSYVRFFLILVLVGAVFGYLIWRMQQERMDRMHIQKSSVQKQITPLPSTGNTDQKSSGIGKAGWKTYSNSQLGFEISYPDKWDTYTSGSSFRINNPQNKKEIIEITIDQRFPSLPDFSYNSKLWSESIDGIHPHEELFPKGYCDAGISCSDPFIGLWTNNYNLFFTITFNNTYKIDGIYKEILSTFRFIKPKSS